MDQPWHGDQQPPPAIYANSAQQQPIPRACSCPWPSTRDGPHTFNLDERSLPSTWRLFWPADIAHTKRESVW